VELNLTQIVAKSAKRVGRGIGSGKGGHTVGKGQKGQGSRGKRKVAAASEGGNIPLHRKLPVQTGFKSLKMRPEAVTISWLNSHTKEGQVVDKAFMMDKNIIMKMTEQAKIVGNDKLAHKITVKGLLVSAGAKKAIETAGGNVID
jgi:large subunit ribosomal protein L15